MKMKYILSAVAATDLMATITWGAPPAGGMGGGRAGGMGMGGGGMGGMMGGGARMGGGGSRGGNTGDTAPSNNPTAKSLSTPTTPSAKTYDQGFIRRWSILEPASPSSASSQNAFTENAHKEYFKDQMKIIPKDGEKTTINGTELAWHQLESKNFNVNLVHFANDLHISSVGVMFFVVTVVNSPEEVKDAHLSVGSNDASWWWLNGQDTGCSVFNNVLSVPDQSVSKKLTLKKGPNVIRGIINNTQGQTDFNARLLDKDFNPITNVSITLSAEGL